MRDAGHMGRGVGSDSALLWSDRLTLEAGVGLGIRTITIHRDAQGAGRLVSPLQPPATHGIPSWAPAWVSVDGLVLLLQSLGPSLPGLLRGVATDSVLGTMGQAGSLGAGGGMQTALRLP